jgi:hypothetical protein
MIIGGIGVLFWALRTERKFPFPPECMDCQKESCLECEVTLSFDSNDSDDEGWIENYNETLADIEPTYINGPISDRKIKMKDIEK